MLTTIYVVLALMECMSVKRNELVIEIEKLKELIENKKAKDKAVVVVFGHITTGVWNDNKQDTST